MNGFLDGFLFGLGAVGIVVLIILPAVLSVLSPWWLLLYLITIPIDAGIIGLIS